MQFSSVLSSSQVNIDLVLASDDRQLSSRVLACDLLVGTHLWPVQADEKTAHPGAFSPSSPCTPPAGGSIHYEGYLFCNDY